MDRAEKGEKLRNGAGESHYQSEGPVIILAGNASLKRFSMDGSWTSHMIFPSS